MVDTEEQERNTEPSGPLAITHNNQVKHTDHIHLNLIKNLTFEIQTSVPDLDTFFQFGGKAPETLSSYVVNNSENKPIHTPPSFPLF